VHTGRPVLLSKTAQEYLSSPMYLRMVKSLANVLHLIAAALGAAVVAVVAELCMTLHAHPVVKLRQEHAEELEHVHLLHLMSTLYPMEHGLYTDQCGH